MEADRCRNDKVRCAVLDTNVLMYIYTEKVDVFAQLRELGFNKFIVPSKVVQELKNLSISLTGKERQAAKFALSLIERFCEIVDIETIGTDIALLETAKRFGCILITNDKRLKKKAKQEGIPIGYLREMKYVAVESEVY
jgi:rRNA-processing protein FCF1